MSFVATRKRKDAHNTRPPSPEKGKVRVVEKSGDDHHDAFAKFPRLKPSLPNSRGLAGFRRGSVKIFSVFRTGKGMLIPYPLFTSLTEWRSS